MEANVVFNLTVCALGVLVLLIHIANILMKKNRRKDENSLLSFFIFTMVHFLTYLIFTLVNYFLNQNGVHNDALVIAFYTIFYIMNNVEVLLFYLYLSSYVNNKFKAKKAADIANFILFGLIVVSDIVNIFTRMYFTSEGGQYTRGDFMFFAQTYQFLVLGLCLLLVLFDKALNTREKIGFSLYVFLPAVSIVVQNFMKGYAIAYAALLLAVEILFLFLNVEKNIRLEEDEKKLKDANMKIMVSQIQPHFVYNTLSSISTLITISPREAQKALDYFSDYLRMNFSSLTDTRLVSFGDELEHIKVYTTLEKLRFGDRLNFVYDVQSKDFFVPPLSVQPVVENAIKHGVFNKIDGGTVTLRAYETDEAFVVEVIDDGVGFDMNEVNFKNNEHIGLNNVRQRITSMCKGDIVFESEKNKGTKVTISFYKE